MYHLILPDLEIIMPLKCRTALPVLTMSGSLNPSSF